MNLDESADSILTLTLEAACFEFRLQNHDQIHRIYAPHIVVDANGTPMSCDPMKNQRSTTG